MKRLLSLLTLTALLATTACSAGEGSAVLSGTTGTSAPTAATAAATSPESLPSEPEPDYPTVNYVQEYERPYDFFYPDMVEVYPSSFVYSIYEFAVKVMPEDSVPAAICLVTLTGIDVSGESVCPIVRIDRIEMRTSAFSFQEGDEVQGVPYHQKWTAQPDGSYNLQYSCWGVPMGEFGRQYYVFLGEKGALLDWGDFTYNPDDPYTLGEALSLFHRDATLMPLSIPLPDSGTQYSTEQLEEYCDSLYNSYFCKYRDLPESEQPFYAISISRSVLKHFVDRNLHDEHDQYELWVETAIDEFELAESPDSLTDADLFDCFSMGFDLPKVSQYLVSHD